MPELYGQNNLIEIAFGNHLSNLKFQILNPDTN